MSLGSVKIDCRGETSQSLRRIWAALGVICISSAILLVAGRFVPGPTSLIADTTSINHDGGWTEVDSDQGSLRRWSSWGGSDQRVGELWIGAFTAPRSLTMQISGFPGTDGNSLYLLSLTTGERWTLNIPDPGESWATAAWSLPEGWVGDNVVLVASDQSTGWGGWLGIGTPSQTSGFSLLRTHSRSLAILPATVVSIALMLLPGVSIAVLWERVRCLLHPGQILAFGVLVSAGLGYLGFWAYLLDRRVGFVFSGLVAVLTLVLVAQVLRSPVARHLATSPEISGLALLLIGITVFYLGILYAAPGGTEDALSQNRFGLDLPIDHAIPRIFAERLYQGASPKHLVGDWLSSDRPPLQTGMHLLQMPIAAPLDLGALHYQVQATAIQCAWVPAVWALGNAIALGTRRTALVILMAACSGFFLVNSTFVWPKLIAAALVVFALALVMEESTEHAWRRDRVLLAAVAAGLGMMAHSAVGFLIPGFVLVSLRRRATDWRTLLIGAVALSVVMAPWLLYQKLYEPPGNRLVKWHIAGVIPIDDRSSAEAILDSYQDLDWPQWIDLKVENTAMLLRYLPRQGASIMEVRSREFFQTGYSLGVLNLGWLVLAMAGLLSGERRRLLSATPLLLGAAMVGLATWILVMFGPGTTSIHQGSYATMVLLFVVLTVALTSLPTPLLMAVAGLQVFVFADTWIRTPPELPSVGIDPLSAAVAVLGGFLAVAAGIVLHRDGAPNGPT